MLSGLDKDPSAIIELGHEENIPELQLNIEEVDVPIMPHILNAVQNRTKCVSFCPTTQIFL